MISKTIGFRGLAYFQTYPYTIINHNLKNGEISGTPPPMFFLCSVKCQNYRTRFNWPALRPPTRPFLKDDNQKDSHAFKQGQKVDSCRLPTFKQRNPTIRNNVLLPNNTNVSWLIPAYPSCARWFIWPLRSCASWRVWHSSWQQRFKK